MPKSGERLPMPESAGMRPVSGTSPPFLTEVMHSTPDPATVAALVGECYDVGRISECHLLRRGFNDVYEVKTEKTGRFVLRLSGSRLRRRSDVEYETSFLEHLDRSGVPVAAPIQTTTGWLWASVIAPEGERTAVLFRYVPGRAAQRGSKPDAAAQGETLARIHLAGRTFQAPGKPPPLDEYCLLVQPTKAVRSLPFVDHGTAAAVEELVSRLIERLHEARGSLAWGHCHGDCHGLNARITETGPLRRLATFFDFDDGGPGWLAYDLAVYLWNKALNPETLDLWPSFLEGYRSVHALSDADLDAILLYVPIRHVWLVGQYADKIREWGTEAVPPTWFKSQLDFITRWEERHLSPGRLL